MSLQEIKNAGIALEVKVRSFGKRVNGERSVGLIVHRDDAQSADAIEVGFAYLAVLFPIKDGIVEGLPNALSDQVITVRPNGNSEVVQPERVSSQNPRNGQAPASPSGSQGRAHPAQQIALTCNEPLFWEFLGELGYRVSNAEEAAQMVREGAEVKSRSEIIEGTPAFEFWQTLMEDYRIWQLAQTPIAQTSSLTSR